MRPLSATAVAAAVLVLAACGGGRDEEAGGDVLAAAAAETIAAGSSKAVLTLSARIPGQEEPVLLTGAGAFDYATGRGQVTYDLSALFASLGVPGGGEPVEAVYDGAVAYLQTPSILAAFLPSAKPWLKLDPATLDEGGSVDLSQLAPLVLTAPPLLLGYLQATGGEAEEVGEEQVAGVDTTRYRTAVGLGDATAQVPIDVWVDADGLVRKLEVRAPGPEPEAPGAVVTVELSDFGAVVEAEPPPADQVTDLAELAASAGG